MTTTNRTTTIPAMLLAASLALGLAGCSSTPTTTATGTGSGTSAAPTGGSTNNPTTNPTGSPSPPATGSTGTTPPGTTGAACDDDLEVVNAAAEEAPGLEDGPLTIETAWADQGPHPDNTVDQDGVLELVFAEHEIEVDPQFGRGIPVGIPDVPDGTTYVAFRLTATGGTIEEGATYSSADSASDGGDTDGTLDAYLYHGATRLLPGDLDLTITTLTDDEVCGTITATTATSLQQFVGIEGSFRADRIQALEAAEDR